jgi:hypothetical protein
MSILKKLKKKSKPTRVTKATKFLAYFEKLKSQELIKVENKAIYIYRVLLTLGESPESFIKNLYTYALATSIIDPGQALRIIDMETNEIINHYTK